jgi:hypothetical protein
MGPPTNTDPRLCNGLYAPQGVRNWTKKHRLWVNTLTAVARELLGFVLAIACQAEHAQEATQASAVQIVAISWGSNRGRLFSSNVSVRPGSGASPGTGNPRRFYVPGLDRTHVTRPRQPFTEVRLAVASPRISEVGLSLPH